jgi:hypothetical protein
MDSIDLTTETKFHHLAWIGVGKKFSDPLPQAVYDKKREILKVPDPFLTQLPLSMALVHEFIHHPLPLQSSNLSFYPTEEWFSTNAPRTKPNVLLTRPIPPETVLRNLDIVAGQMWFDGASSIVDPRFNNSAERFPLWVLSLWKVMQKMIEHQKLWRSSIHWLELITHPKDDVVQAWSLIGRLPWNEPLHSRGASTLEFAGFLGASWLSDTQIDMMVELLQNRMKTKGCLKGVLVEPLVFFWELVSVGNKLKEPLTSPYLSRLADQI